MKSSIIATGIFASAVSAHFSVTYPFWRGNSYPTQWTYPCGGIVANETTDQNRTLWPLDGGAIAFKPTHSWAQTYINMGLGANATQLNITLVAPFNQTSNGTFCLPKVTLPEGLEPKEGDKATIQVIQLTTRGGALYNCADIEFSSKAVDPSPEVCFNSTGVGAQPLDYDGSEEVKHKDDKADDDKDDKSGAVSINPNVIISVMVGALAVAGLMA